MSCNQPAERKDSMKYALAFATAAAAIVASAAFAGEKSSAAKAMDHKAMEEKMNAKMEAHFKEVDANADGSITEQELLDFVTAKAKADFAAMAGEDGVIKFAEMKAHHHAKHEEMMKEDAATAEGGDHNHKH